MADMLNAGYPVLDPDSRGLWKNMAIRAGAQSAFGARVDFKSSIYDKNGREILGGASAAGPQTAGSIRYTFGGTSTMAPGKIQFVDSNNAPCRPDQSPVAIRISKKDINGVTDLRLVTFLKRMRLLVRKLNTDGEPSADALCYFVLGIGPSNNGNENGFYQWAIEYVTNLPGSVWTQGDTLVVEVYTPSFLEDLSNTEIPFVPTVGQVLTYKGIDAGWGPADAASGGGPSNGTVTPALRCRVNTPQPMVCSVPGAAIAPVSGLMTIQGTPTPVLTTSVVATNPANAGVFFQQTAGVVTLPYSTDVAAAVGALIEIRVSSGQYNSIPMNQRRWVAKFEITGISATGWAAGGVDITAQALNRGTSFPPNPQPTERLYGAPSTIRLLGPGLKTNHTHTIYSDYPPEMTPPLHSGGHFVSLIFKIADPAAYSGPSGEVTLTFENLEAEATALFGVPPDA
jgi:hypothetical protein